MAARITRGTLWTLIARTSLDSMHRTAAGRYGLGRPDRDRPWVDEEGAARNRDDRTHTDDDARPGRR
jgi:hypothetical protein